jgi:Ni,Fe-hydrogenase III large subunit
MLASALVRAAASEPCRPWSRRVLPLDEWAQMAAALADEPTVALLGLWADTVQVHALLLDEAIGEVLLASTAVVAGRYSALSPSRPLAAWFERTVQDLFGHIAIGGTDQRPWLDHGNWPHTQPMAPRPGTAGGSPEPPEFLPVDSEDLHQIPLGPIHGGIQPPAHLRVTASGETIVRLETRLGYTHKGTLTLMRGKSPRTAARFAARLSGEATVAHGIAFARAAEAALGVEAPSRAMALRAVMAEVERIAGHLGDLRSICNAAGFAIPAARCAWHVEAVRRAAAIAFGHRLMMDCVVPGGVAVDIAPGGPEAVRRVLVDLASQLSELEQQLNRGTWAGIGVIATAQAKALAAGGPVGRAAGRDFDARRLLGCPLHAALTIPVLSAGDVLARTELRLMEIAESVRLVPPLLDSLPSGAISVALPAESGEGVGCAEGPRGDIWCWLRLDHGQIASAFSRDPAWTHWPLLEAAAAGAQASDLPVIQASLGATSSGVDL